MSKDILYVFDGSFLGFLTVIFECFQNKTFDCKIVEDNNVQESFYFQNIDILTDEKKAQRVINGIKNKISENYHKLQVIYAKYQKNYKK